MASQEDVEHVAQSLPGSSREGVCTYRANGRLFTWLWRERVDPKKARVPNPDVLVVSVGDEQDKYALIDLDPDIFFTESHYDGWPAVLVRLPRIDVDLLTKLIRDAHAVQMAKKPPRPRR